MEKLISTKTSGQQVIFYQNGDKKYALSHSLVRSYYFEDQYDINTLPDDLKEVIVKELTGCIDSSPVFILGSVLWTKSGNYLCKEDCFFTKKEEVIGEDDFTMIK